MSILQLVPAGDPNETLIRDYERHLRVRNLSDRTRRAYLDGVRLLAEFLGNPDLAGISKADVERFLADQLARHAPSTAATRHRDVRQFTAWMHAEDITGEDVAAKIPPPSVPSQPVPEVPDDQLRTLLASMSGTGFEDRRDTAIVRLFVDTGMRLAGMAGIRLEVPAGQPPDLDFDLDVVRIIAKGRHAHTCPFGPETGQALTRYLRARRRHPQQHRPELWLGRWGPLTANGIYQMIERRARAAGLPHIHPHMLRHSFATAWLRSGGGETDLMRLAGWSSREMIGRYTESVAGDLAREAHRRLNPGGRL